LAKDSEIFKLATNRGLCITRWWLRTRTNGGLFIWRFYNNR